MLVEGDRVLTDSPVILEYLEERFPDPPLYPAEPARRAELRTFVDWFNRVWKRPPNLIVDEEREAEPDRDRIAELEQRDRRARCRSSRICSPDATTSSVTSSPPPTSSRSRSSSTQCSGRTVTRSASTRCCGRRSGSTAATRVSRPGSTESTRCRGRSEGGKKPGCCSVMWVTTERSHSDAPDPDARDRAVSSRRTGFARRSRHALPTRSDTASTRRSVGSGCWAGIRVAVLGRPVFSR